MSNALQDKICVVTGATRGIGRGCAVALAEKGATVFVTGRSDAMANSPFRDCRRYRSRCGKGFGFKVDHGVDSEIEAFFAKVAEQAGKIDILVNNVYKIPHLPPGVAAFGIIPFYLGRPGRNRATRTLRRELACGALLFAAGEGGLIVNVSSPGGQSYHFSSSYGAGRPDSTA